MSELRSHHHQGSIREGGGLFGQMMSSVCALGERAPIRPPLLLLIPHLEPVLGKSAHFTKVCCHSHVAVSAVETWFGHGAFFAGMPVASKQAALWLCRVVRFA